MTSEADRLIAEWELIAWAAAHRRRDEIIRAARAAGISKHRIHVLTGVARSTIDRALNDEAGPRVSRKGPASSRDDSHSVAALGSARRSREIR